LEAFFPGIAVVAAAVLNLSHVSFRTRVLSNLILAFTSTYTFANGMLLWPLAWPLAAANEPPPRRERIWWCVAYAAAGFVSIGCYFIGYHRPSYHPELVSVGTRLWDLLHYFVLWVGNYFASDFANPLGLGIIALLFFIGGVALAFEAIKRGTD